TLFYGDRSCRKNPVDFFPITMKKVAFSSLYDWYEVEFESKFNRICYYFQLVDKEGESILYYGDSFEKEICINRNEYFQLPYNHRSDRLDIPSWAKDAVVYNIFPDSFATERSYISSQPSSTDYNGYECKGLQGGTIRGIKENLDYIQELGFDTIYLNPIFVAGEYHKYDLVDYYHIDPVFGTDKEFKTLVDDIHKRGMRIIVDGVFNHCGWHFFAFEDVVKKGKASKYWSWFHRLEEPVVIPDTWEEYPRYECFGYERMMPKLATDNPEVQEYFIDVARYWTREFDIDGWRLDVASEVCDSFWINFRREIKRVKKECLLIGEVWESAGHWLDGKMFDSTMNYDFRRHLMRYFAYEDIDAEEFNSRVTNMLMRYRKEVAFAQLNLLDSHDVSRFLSLTKGDERKMGLAVVFLMTFVGMPCVFYGDELGVMGEEEKDYRQPMPWDRDRGYLYNLYKELISLRKREKALREGSFEVEKITENGVYIYSRRVDESVIRVIINRTTDTYYESQENVISQRGYDNGRLEPYGYAILRGEI
ncbi:MAG: glycoside hydrolase family 13 protein, partial [Candidatus Ornithospirochaeta sp.]